MSTARRGERCGSCAGPGRAARFSLAPPPASSPPPSATARRSCLASTRRSCLASTRRRRTRPQHWAASRPQHRTRPDRESYRARARMARPQRPQWPRREQPARAKLAQVALRSWRGAGGRRGCKSLLPRQAWRDWQLSCRWPRSAHKLLRFARPGAQSRHSSPPPPAPGPQSWPGRSQWAAAAARTGPPPPLALGRRRRSHWAAA